MGEAESPPQRVGGAADIKKKDNDVVEAEDDLEVNLPGGVARLERDEEFDAEEFVEEIRKVLGLQQSKKATKSEQARLKGLLMKLVNEHYAEFVEIPSELRRLETQFPTFHQLLKRLEEAAQSARAAISPHRDELHRLLTRKRELDRVRRLKERALESHKSLKSLEQQLQWHGESWHVAVAPATLLKDILSKGQRQRPATGGPILHSSAAKLPPTPDEAAGRRKAAAESRRKAEEVARAFTGGDFLSHVISLVNISWTLRRLDVWTSVSKEVDSRRPRDRSKQNVTTDDAKGESSSTGQRVAEQRESSIGHDPSARDVTIAEECDGEKGEDEETEDEVAELKPIEAKLKALHAACRERVEERILVFLKLLDHVVTTRWESSSSNGCPKDEDKDKSETFGQQNLNGKADDDDDEEANNHNSGRPAASADGAKVDVSRLLCMGLTHVCRAAVILGEEDTVIAAIREVTVQPGLDQALAIAAEAAGGTAVRASHSLSRQLASRSDISTFLGVIVSRVVAPSASFGLLARHFYGSASPSSSPAEADSSGSNDIDKTVDSKQEASRPPQYSYSSVSTTTWLRIPVVTASFMLPLIEVLQKEFAAAFLPAAIDTYLRNYSATVELFEEGIALMPLDEATKFRSSSALRGFVDRWKTNVYYSLIAKEKLASFESSLSKATSFEEKFIFQEQVLWLKPSVELVRHVTRLFTSDFIPREFPKALAFLFKIFSIYRRHLSSFFDFLDRRPSRSPLQDNPQHSVVGAAAKQQPQPQPPPAASPWRSDLHALHIAYIVSDVLTIVNLVIPTDAARALTSSAQPAADSTTAAAALPSRVSDLCDSSWTAARKPYYFGSLLTPALEELAKLCPRELRRRHTTTSEAEATDCRRLMELRAANDKQTLTLAALTVEAFDSCAADLIELKTKFEKHLVDCVAQSATKPLAAIASIPRLYRMTNKPPPKNPSPYVANCVQPLKEFAEFSRNVLASMLLREWMSEVVSVVAANFRDQAENLLLTVHQQGETVRRLRLQVQQSAGAAGASNSVVSPLSDVDNISLQIRLDVNSFAKQCEDSLGLDEIQMREIQVICKTIDALTEEAYGRFLNNKSSATAE